MRVECHGANWRDPDGYSTSLKPRLTARVGVGVPLAAALQIEGQIAKDSRRRVQGAKSRAECDTWRPRAEENNLEYSGNGSVPG